MKNIPRAVVTQTSAATRIERDTMGELAVPASAYYGVQTARAIENFPISSLRFPRAMIRAMGLIKRAAATVNQSLGLLDKKPAEAINQACREVVADKNNHTRDLGGSATTTQVAEAVCALVAR